MTGRRTVAAEPQEVFHDRSFHNAYRLAPVDGGTQVTYDLLFPLVGKPNIRTRMRLLKAKVESAQADSASRS